VILFPSTRAYLKAHWCEVALLMGFPFVGLALDWLNQCPLDLYLRGLSRNFVFVAAAIVSSAIARRMDRWRVVTLFCVLALSTPVAALIQIGEDLGSESAFLKYFGGWALILPIVVIMTRLVSPAVAGALMVPVGMVVAFGLSLRSFGGVLVLAGVFTMTARWWARGGRRILTACVLVIPVLFAVAAINLLQSDHVPAELRENWDASNFQRLDTAIDAWQGFLEKPLMGNGSWAHALRYTIMNQTGLVVGVHSFILQFAFEYGFFGLVFGAWLLWLGVQGVVSFLRPNDQVSERWMAVYVLIMFNFVYTVLMSPMGGYERIIAGVALGIALSEIWDQRQQLAR